MAIFSKLANDIEEVDVIIAGGGTAACIVAARLADADANLSILVIEQGTDNYNMPTVVNPAFFMSHLVPGSKTALFYKGNKVARLGDRIPIVPSGGILGGGSSINFTMYTRAQRDDFDAWNTEGWSANDVLPYLRKFETYHGRGSKKYHGFDGPLHISGGTYRQKVSEEDFINAMGQVGYPEFEDLNSYDTNNGVQRWLRYVDSNGKRQDTAHRYLHPRLRDGKHPNLHVLVEAQVVRVLFEEGASKGQPRRAVGVEYRPNRQFQAQGISQTHTPTRTIRARKLVIVSCGACGTPGVLERSGLGDPAVLKKAKVPVVADLPGVGHAYQDHNLLLPAYRAGVVGPEGTLDGVLSGRESAKTWLQERNPKLGWNSIDVMSKIRPTEAEVDALGPEFRAAWDRDFKDAPNRPLMLIAMVNSFLGDHSAIPPGEYFTLGAYTAYPYSRGHIHITGPSPDDPLDFETGFFSDDHDIDLKKVMWAYKKQREVARRMRIFRGELAAAHPPFAKGSAAAVLERVSDDEAPVVAPGAGPADTISYTAEDDRVLEQWLRENTNTTWHSLGTCKMARREDLGVVDSSLGVYGVRGLKIADLSIAPENVGANTNNTALMIGEKAADIFIRELGLGGRKVGGQWATSSPRPMSKL
ncbi:hypothetical protein SLS62_007387 [Diatrype stigma]|uniref:Glucose-methanol-choline oxidoreductase N-terminal domain-containing protein n=1 Tax=Diatrype stigma TaxID=117547 RepID=A0AAN9UPU3_9PEZI